VKVADRLHGPFGLAEGLADALYLLLEGWPGPLWAAMNAGNMARFPVLPDVTGITLFPDRDAPNLCTGRRAGADAAHECHAHWSAAGRGARIATTPAGKVARDPGSTAPDRRALFDVQAAIREFEGSFNRADGEARAYECCNIGGVVRPPTSARTLERGDHAFARPGRKAGGYT
jgi:hypothetical protein